MKFVRNSKLVFHYGVCLILLSGLISAGAQQFESGKKAKAKGTIQSRNGDLVTIKDKKSGDVAVIALSDSTKIERTRDFRLRRADMDITAMVPGLTIDAEGVGNAKGQLEANKITFDPNVFAVEVAEEQQIQANQAAAARAQSTANQGVAAANQAQTSANAAQASANQAGQAAVAAGGMAVGGGPGGRLGEKRGL